MRMVVVLPGGVRAQHGEKFPAWDRQAEVVDRHELTERFTRWTNSIMLDALTGSSKPRLPQQSVWQFDGEDSATRLDDNDRLVTVQQARVQTIDAHLRVAIFSQ